MSDLKINVPPSNEGAKNADPARRSARKEKKVRVKIEDVADPKDASKTKKKVSVQIEDALEDVNAALGTDDESKIPPVRGILIPGSKKRDKMEESDASVVEEQGTPSSESIGKDESLAPVESVEAPEPVAEESAETGETEDETPPAPGTEAEAVSAPEREDSQSGDKGEKPYDEEPNLKEASGNEGDDGLDRKTAETGKNVSSQDGEQARSLLGSMREFASRHKKSSKRETIYIQTGTGYAPIGNYSKVVDFIFTFAICVSATTIPLLIMQLLFPNFLIALVLTPAIVLLVPYVAIMVCVGLRISSAFGCRAWGNIMRRIHGEGYVYRPGEDYQREKRLEERLEQLNDDTVS